MHHLEPVENFSVLNRLVTTIYIQDYQLFLGMLTIMGVGEEMKLKVGGWVGVGVGVEGENGEQAQFHNMVPANCTLLCATIPHDQSATASNCKSLSVLPIFELSFTHLIPGKSKHHTLFASKFLACLPIPSMFSFCSSLVGTGGGDFGGTAGGCSSSSMRPRVVSAQ